MKNIKLFLVGIGGYGSFYMNELEKMDDPSIIIEGVCEVVPGTEDCYPMIQEKKIPVYRSIEDFYREHEADLAILSTPIHLHHGQVLECLGHGSNVLIEKPICTTLEEAEEIRAKEQETGLFTAVGYQMNYAENMLAIKQDILSRKFGKPVLMKAIHGFKRGEKYYHRNRWAGKRIVDGFTVNDSPFQNSNAHQFQSMTFLLGNAMDRSAEISQIRAELYRANENVENFDTAAVCAITEDQVPIYYYTSHNSHEPELGPISEFHFEDAVIYLGKDYGDGPLMEYVAEWKDGRKKSYGPVPTAWNLKKLYDSIACARDGGHPVCTVQAATPHLKAVLALSSMPIHPVKAECLEVTETQDDKFWEIRNLEEIFDICFKEQKLPSEAGAEWAVVSKTDS